MMPNTTNRKCRKVRWLSLLLVGLFSAFWLFPAGNRLLQEQIDQALKSYVEQSFEEQAGLHLEIGRLQYQFPCTFTASALSLSRQGQEILKSPELSICLSIKDLLRHRFTFSSFVCKEIESFGYLANFFPTPTKLDLNGTIETNFSLDSAKAALKLIDSANPDAILSFNISSQKTLDKPEIHLLIENPKQGLLNRLIPLLPDYQYSLTLTASLEKLPSILGDFEWSFVNNVHHFGNLSGSYSYSLEKGIEWHNLLGDSGPLIIQGDLCIDPACIIRSCSIRYELAAAKATLNEFLPSFEGLVAGELSLSGPMQNPNFTCTAEASDLRAYRQDLQNFRGTVFGTLSKEKILTAHVDTSFVKSSYPIAIHFDVLSDPSFSFAVNNFSASAPKTEMKGSMTSSYTDGWTEGDMKIESEDVSVFSTLCGHSLSGSGLLEAHLSRKNGQQLRFTAFIPRASIDDKAFEGLEISGSVENLMEIPIGELKIHCRKAQSPHCTIEDFHAETAGAKDANVIPWAISGKGLVNSPMDFQVRGKWMPQKNALELTIDNFEGRIGREDYFLEDSVQVFLTKEKFTVSPFVFRMREASIAASGTWSDNAIQTSWVIRRFPIEVFPLLSPHRPLQGTFTSRADLYGRIDNLQGSISMHLSEFTIPDEAYASVPPMQADISLQLQDRGIKIEGSIEGAQEYEAAFEGEIPAMLSLVPPFLDRSSDLPLQGHFHAKGEIAPFLQLFVADTTNIKGKTETNLEISGTLSKPCLYGKVTVTEGSFESLTTGALMTNIRAVLSVDKQEISLAEFAGEDDQGGTIIGKGSMYWIPRENFPYALGFQMNKASLLRLDAAKAVVSGDVLLEGNTKQCCIRGTIQADRAEVTLPDQTKAAQNTLEIVYINQPPDEKPQLDPLPKRPAFPVSLDLVFTIPKTGIIKGKNLHSKWKGNIQIKGTATAPQLHGELQIVNGEYMFNGKPFSMSEGVISFAGDPDKKTSLYIIAYRDIDQIKAEVIVKGSVKNPALSFRSNPPLPEKEILSWILFNKGIDNITAFQGAQLTDSITTLSAGNGGSDVFSRLRKGLGIDSIDISKKNTSGNNEVSIKVGKYISRGVFVSVNKSISSETNRVGIEANLSPNLKVQAEVGDDAEGQMHLKWKHDY